MTEVLMQRKRQKEQKWICATVCALISYSPITSIINDIVNLFVSSQFIYDSLVCYIVLLIMLIGTLIIVGRNIKRDVIYFGFFLMTAWVIAYVFFPYNKIYMYTQSSDVLENPVYILFVFSFIGYFFTRYITDYDLFIKYFIRFSIVVVIVSVASFFITLEDDYQKQYLVFSYNMLVQIVCLIIMFFEKKRLSYIIVGAIGFVVMFMAGSRGATICGLGSVMIYFLFRKCDWREKLLVGVVIGITLFFVIGSFDNMLSWVSNLAESFGMDSYTLTRIQDGEFLNDSGRGDIQKRIIEGFSWLGSGLYGDRILGRGHYAHNFFIEIIAQLGYLIGTPILVFALYLIIRGLLAGDERIRILIAIFMSTGFLKLLLSGSYLNREPAFYILFGLCMNVIMAKREKNEDITH